MNPKTQKIVIDFLSPFADDGVVKISTATSKTISVKLLAKSGSRLDKAKKLAKALNGKLKGSLEERGTVVEITKTPITGMAIKAEFKPPVSFGVAAGGANLGINPLKLGIADDRKWHSVRDLPDMLHQGINKNVKHDIADYLHTLVDHYAAPSTKSKIILRDIVTSNPDYLGFNEIAKDFGEALGPLMIRSGKLFSDMNIASVLFPARSNEPLIDYKVQDNKGFIINVSAKTHQSSTNTVKFADILNIMGDVSAAEKRKIEYKVAQYLGDPSLSTLDGPYQLLEEIGPNFYRQFPSLKLFPRDIDTFIVQAAAEIWPDEKKKVHMESRMKAAEAISNLAKKPFALRFIHEKIIEQLSVQGAFDFSLYVEKLFNSVRYVKTGMPNTPTSGELVVLGISDYKKVFGSSKKISIRSKNGFNRIGRSDRLGLQL